LRQQDGVTEKDIEQYKKSIIIQKSLDIIKQKANQQAAIRNSPNRYSNVKSKVARCIKVSNKTALNNKKSRNNEATTVTAEDIRVVNSRSMFDNKLLNSTLSVE
jgi:hypothetical protein